MVERKWTPANIQDAFFEVSTQPVYWFDGFWKHEIHGQKAIVDESTGNALSVVSSKYNVITNKTAYELCKHIINHIFSNVKLEDFQCFNILMPKTKGSCRIDLIIPQTYHSPFGDRKENWTPFIRISNSYNRTVTLKYEVGFCRWICLNGVIFNQTGVTLSYTHSENIDESQIVKHLKNLKSLERIDKMWETFDKKMNTLQEILIPESMALPIFCKAFGIEIDKDEVSERQKETLGIKASQIIDSSKEYFKELGNNAYAVFNVLTDYASYPQGISSIATAVHGFQRKVGDWVDEIVVHSKQEGFNLYDYIGKEVMNTAFFLESLVSKEDKK